MDTNNAVTIALTVLTVAMTIVSIVLAVAMVSAKLKLRVFQSNYEMKTYFLLAFSSLLAKVAMSDGGMSASEEVAVERMLHVMGLPRSEHAMCLGNFLMGRNDTRNIKSVAAEFASKMGVDAAALMYALLWRIANIDGRIDDGEKAVLDEIAMAMSLPEHIHVGFRSGAASNLDKLSLIKSGVPQSLVKLVM